MVKDPVVLIKINLTAGRVTFLTSKGQKYEGTAATDLEPRSYSIVPNIPKKKWIIPGTDPGLRFSIELENADPWALPYPKLARLEVVAGGKEDLPIGEVLPTEDMVPIEGDPASHSNYIQNAIRGVGIFGWGGPFRLDRRVVEGMGVDSIYLPRSEVHRATRESKLSVLRREDQGKEVRELQRLLRARGYPVDVDGDFGTRTYQAVRAFQSQNLDQHGQPLVVDGKAGPLTWWSLTHSKPDLEPVQAVDFATMPPASAGGSRLGRAVLKAAIGEVNAGAQEIGGDNRGPFVQKYLQPAGLPEGNSWCASFVSWCVLQACGGVKERMPFTYCPGARALLKQFQDEGWAFAPQA